MAEPLVVRLILDSGDFNRGIRKTSGATRKAKAETESWSKGVGKLAAGFISAQVIMGAFTRAMRALTDQIKGGIKNFADFDRSVRKVSTLLAGPGVDAAKQIGAELLKLDSRLGSTKDLVEATYEALSAGVEPAEAVAFVGEAAKLAKAGFTDLTTAIDVTTTIIKAYGLELDETVKVMDILITTQKLGKTTVGAFGQVIGRVIPLASATNVAFEEIAAALATLTAGGIKTEETVTGLVAIFTAILKPSDEAAKAAENMGVDLSAAALKAKGLAGVLKDVQDATGGSTEKITSLFGNVRGLIPVLSLVGARSKDFAKNLTEIRKQATLGTITQESFNKVTKGMGEQMEAALVDFTKLRIELAQEFEPVLLRLIQGFTDYTRKLKESGDAMRNVETGTSITVGLFQVFGRALLGLRQGFEVVTTGVLGFSAAVGFTGGIVTGVFEGIGKFLLKLGTGFLAAFVMITIGVLKMADKLPFTDLKDKISATESVLNKLVASFEKPITLGISEAVFEFSDVLGGAAAISLNKVEEMSDSWADMKKTILGTNEAVREHGEQVDEIVKNVVRSLSLEEEAFRKIQQARRMPAPGVSPEVEQLQIELAVFQNAANTRVRITEKETDQRKSILDRFRDAAAANFSDLQKDDLEALRTRGATEMELLEQRLAQESSLLFAALAARQVTFQEFQELSTEVLREAEEEKRLIQMETFAEQNRFMAETAEAFGISLEEQNLFAEAAYGTIRDFGIGAFKAIEQAVSDTVFAAVTGEGEIRDVWAALAKTLLKSVIEALVRIGVQFFITSLIAKKAAASQAASNIAGGVGATFANTMASISAIPLIGPFLAPAIAAANAALAASGAAAGIATGGAIGLTAGAFAHGADFVERTGPALVHRGERIIPEVTNRDLTEFLREQTSRQTVGTQLTINVGEFVGDDEASDRLAERVADAVDFRNVTEF